MDRHEDLADFIRDACRRKRVSLGEASRAMGKSRNWLERIANYDSETGKGIKRPRVDSCKIIARYFDEDPNYVLQLAGYISIPTSPTPIVDEITTIARLLHYDDQRTLLEHARLLKLRADVGTERPQFPTIPGIKWDQLDSTFAQNLAEFIRDEPDTVPIWVEALSSLPEKAVELLLVNARNQVFLRDEIEADRTARVLTRLAHTL